MINKLEMVGDGAVMLDYTGYQASLLHLKDHIRTNLSHSCQSSASARVLLRAVGMSNVCVCMSVCLVSLEHGSQVNVNVSK